MTSGAANTAAFRTRLALGLLSANVLLLSPAARAAAACDPMVTEQRALEEVSISLRGSERASRAVQFPANSTVIVLARENGLDVTLEVTQSTRLIARADSPIRRTGIQRASIVTRDAAGYSLSVVGKEHPGAAGTTQLRIVAIPTRTASGAECLQIQRLLASADGAYAAGQAVTRGLAIEPKVDAPTSYKAAAHAYEYAAQRLATPGASELLAETQHSEAAVLYLDLSDWSGANAWAEKASRTYDTVQNAYGHARADALRGAALIEIAGSGQGPVAAADPSRAANETLAKARALLTDVASFHSRRGEHYDEALSLNNIGITFYTQGLYDEAIRAYERVLPLYKELGETPRLAQVLTNIALVEFELGRLSDAIPHYEQALVALSSQATIPRMTIIALSNSAMANLGGGNYDVALKQSSEALTLARDTQDVYAQAVVLHNMASVYYMVGDEKQALELYDESLKLVTVQTDSRGRVATLRAVANILREQGRAQEALGLHQQALSLASAAPVRAQIQVHIARDLNALGRSGEAARQIESVLSQRFAGDEMVHARALLERGRLRQASGEGAGAEGDLRAAMRTFTAFDAPQDEFDAWIALARLKRRDAPAEAFAALDKALALAEELRVQSANPELRAVRLQPLRPAFGLKIAMLADRYFGSHDARGRQRMALDALATAEQARARALQDFANLDVSAPGVSPELVARRRNIYRELAARRARLDVTLDRAGSGDAHVALIRSDIATLRQQLDQIDAQIGAASAAARAPERARAMRAAFDPATVPADVAIIEYWVGTEDAYVWAATREGVVMAKAGGGAALNDAARRLHTALKGFGGVPLAQRLQLGEALYEAALKPVEAQIAGKRRLLIAPDGALHYIPFATLRSGGAASKRFLVESHDIAVIPSIGMLRIGQSRSAHTAPPKEMLLVDDPVYALDDVRLAGVTKTGNAAAAESRWLNLFRGGERGGDLPRLPATAQEATTIARLLPAGQVDRLEGFAATRDSFLNAGLGRYRLIHVASHAISDSEVPQASALILSTFDRRSQQIDGRVLAADFMNIRLNADAVVLSACDTALGKSVAGEGLMGLRYVVLARGAKSVVSSLWPAPDQGTAELMVRFYTALLRDRASGAAALGDAMRGMLRGPFADPSVWGTFAISVSEINEGD